MWLALVTAGWQNRLSSIALLGNLLQEDLSSQLGIKGDKITQVCRQLTDWVKLLNKYLIFTIDVFLFEFYIEGGKK